MNLGNLSPRARKILLALMAAIGLAVVVLFSRRGTATAAAAPDAAQLGALPAYSTGTGTTFADNGGQAAGLSTDVTGALGDVSTALYQLPDMVGAAVAANVPTAGTLEQVPASPTPADYATAFAAAFMPIAMAATPSGTPNSSVVKAATATARATPAPAPAKAAPVVATHGNTPGAKYTVKAGKDSKGNAGVWHIYSDHKVFVRAK